MRKLFYLELDAGVGAVPGGLVEEVLQGLEHLLQEVSLHKPGLEHLGRLGGKSARVLV